MASISTTPRRAVVDGGLPQGWHVDETEVGDLRLVGELRASGDRPTVTVRRRETTPTRIEYATGRLIDELAQVTDEGVIANCDVWPHPVWGVGRLVQTAYLHGEKTMAHDVYIFVDGPHEFRIEVDCELVSLLAIEDQVAMIVARIRPGTGVRKDALR